jgi:RNA polymerase sigma factor for flagellar operon FliA
MMPQELSATAGGAPTAPRVRPGECIARRRALAPAGRLTRGEGEQLLLAQLPTIQKIIGAVRWRHRLTDEDAEEFGSIVVLRLVRNDYAILRQFHGRNVRAFLTVVIERMFLDFRNERWGKWRPTARSRRAGEVAVLLERLTVRDGFTLEEACAVLATDPHMTADRRQLERLYEGFKSRTRPRFVTTEGIEDVTPAPGGADENVIAAERQAIATRATQALADALSHLSERDGVILALRFADGLSVAAIARTLNLQQKALYRRVERLLDRLRVLLAKHGLAARDVLSVLGTCEVEGIPALRQRRRPRARPDGASDLLNAGANQLRVAGGRTKRQQGHPSLVVLKDPPRVECPRGSAYLC